MTMMIIYAILTLITLFDLFIFANELRKENLPFTCPFCKHQAPDKEFGPTSGLVIMLLLLFGVLPGILYIISYGGNIRRQCPKCKASISSNY